MFYQLMSVLQKQMSENIFLRKEDMEFGGMMTNGWKKIENL